MQSTKGSSEGGSHRGRILEQEGSGSSFKEMRAIAGSELGIKMPKGWKTKVS